MTCSNCAERTLALEEQLTRIETRVNDVVTAINTVGPIVQSTSDKLDEIVSVVKTFGERFSKMNPLQAFKMIAGGGQ